MGAFDEAMWVSAEISEIKLNASGHCYLELVEKQEGATQTTAQARATIWRSNYPRIAKHFAIATGEELVAGMQILAQVEVTYHERYGFSLQIVDIDPAYTLGEVERQRQQTIRQLQEEGVWDLNRSLTAPPALQRIAVVSSAQAAGYQDFYNELKKSPYRFEVTLFEAAMQGEAAEESIVKALERIHAGEEAFDAVVVIRGGGSTHDLSCFNRYLLCAHLAQFPLPVITGIGHDKDVSVADMVAFQPLKTPTAVAGWLVERLEQLDGRLATLALTLRDAVRTHTHAATLSLERLHAELHRRSEALLQGSRQHHERLQERLQKEVRGYLLQQHNRLTLAEEVVTAHHPERLLKLGFALLRGQRGYLRSATQAQAGEEVEIELHDGTITATVNTTKIWQKRS